MSDFQSYKHRAQHYFVTELSRRPRMYFGLRRFKDTADERWSVQRDTDITIDGFPRSSNSSTVSMFRAAQPSPVKISHHRHHAANAIRSAEWDIPTVVLVRRPLDAALSLLALSREGHSVHGRKNRGYFLKPADVLYSWLAYYSAVWPYRDKILIAPFNRVAGDIGPMVDAINDKWKTSFQAEPDSEAVSSPKDLGRHALPTELRSQITQDLKSQYEQNCLTSARLRRLSQQSNDLFERYSNLCPF